MKAILVNDDKSLCWDNVPDPICGDEDCLVKIEAAALNRADLMQREGDWDWTAHAQLPKEAPLQRKNQDGKSEIRFAPFSEAAAMRNMLILNTIC